MTRDDVTILSSITALLSNVAIVYDEAISNQFVFEPYQFSCN